MTRNQFLDLYGDCKVTLSSYYKYTFTFVGTAPGGEVLAVHTGGDASDIYRDDFSVGTRYTVRSLDPYAGTALLPDGSTQEF